MTLAPEKWLLIWIEWQHLFVPNLYDESLGRWIWTAGIKKQFLIWYTAKHGKILEQDLSYHPLICRS